MNEARVWIQPWTDTDLPLLQLLNAPEMTAHLGGPETAEQVAARHKRYVAGEGRGAGQMFSISLLPELEPVGSVGYWERVWQDVNVYETGWSVLSAHQGKGIATAAVAAVIAHARNERKHRYIHAFPSVSNPASNAICRKLDFSFIAACDFEYPPGSIMRCNDWRLDLLAATEDTAPQAGMSPSQR